MKTVKALPILALILVLALAACVPATAVPEQQTPFFLTVTPLTTVVVPTSVQNPVTTPLSNSTPVLPTDVLTTPFVQTPIVETPVLPTVVPTQEVPQTGGNASPFDQAGAFVALYNQLTQMDNLNVQQLGAVQQPYFSVQAQLLLVNGQQVQVFEFDSVSARQEAADMVSSTGESIGGYVPSFVGTPHFWSQGRLLTMYVGSDQQVIDAFTSILGPQINNPVGAAATPVVTQQTILLAQQYLAALLGVNVNQVELVSVQQEQWPNACLGLAQQNESCAQVVTPGYQVLLRVNSQLYQVRTDTVGQQIRVTQGQSQ